MLIFSLWGAISLKYRKTISPLLAKGLICMTFSGWIAILAGWYVTEVGRQPWLVTGVLKTADAVSKVKAPVLSVSLVLYIVVYIVLLFAYITTIFYMARKAGRSKGGTLAIEAEKVVV